MPAGPSGYCHNHDPAREEQRRAAGAVRRRRPVRIDEPEADAVQEPDGGDESPAPPPEEERLPTIRGTLVNLARVDRQIAEIAEGRRGGRDLKERKFRLDALFKRKELLRVTLVGLQAERKRQDDLRNLGEEAQRRAREQEEQAAREAEERRGQEQTGAPKPGNNLIASMLSGSA